MSRGNPPFVPAAGAARGTALPVSRPARLQPAPKAAVRGVKREYGDERATPLITMEINCKSEANIPAKPR